MEQRKDRTGTYWRPPVFALAPSEEWRAGLLVATADAAGEATGELKDRARLTLPAPAWLVALLWLDAAAFALPL
jgi:hypothetical protein